MTAGAGWLPPVGRSLVGELAGLAGGDVRVAGWAHEVRAAADGTEAAVVLRDHSGLVELVGPGLPMAGGRPDVAPESAVRARGRVEVAGSSPGGVRVRVDELRVESRAAGPLPLGDDAPLDDRLDWRYLDLRRPRNRLVFEVQTTVERAMREWWGGHGFLEIHSPKMRAVPNASGRELFTIGYFDRSAYLVQSPQFYKQMAMSAGFERVFEIGPVFRANPLRTSRHDTEFTSVDVEVSWIDSHDDVMAVEERWLRHVVAAVEHEHGAEIERRFGRRVRVPEVPFPRMTMAEAQKVLADRGHQVEGGEGDIDARGERLVAEHVAAEVGHELVFVTEYPAHLRPFYHMRLDDDSELTRSFDLLWDGLEVTTGAQREHRHDRLVAQAATDPARLAVVRPYLDFFRFGCPPHGGFGLGLTRMLMCLLGLADVREATYLPRRRDRLTP
ncbi:MAG TPA: aspartate--tRNA(Asn) ligase [Acidimicrobiales bacterium]|nr:aspartate--tRNA(Asn) ligase [Acidimicrobiales bacterium]